MTDDSLLDPGRQRPAQLIWLQRVRPVRDPLILRGILFAVGATFLICAVLLAFLQTTMGDAATLPATIGILALVCLGLIAAFYLVAALMSLRGIDVRFSLDEAGVTYETVDVGLRRALVGGLLLSLLARNPSGAGASLLALSNANVHVPWNSLDRVRYRPERRQIQIGGAGRWRLTLDCHPDNYDEAAAFVASRLPAPRARATGGANLAAIAGAMLRLAMIFAAVAPLYALPYPLEVDPFLPFLIVCFALAAEALAPLLAWVVLLGIGAASTQICWALFSLHASAVHRGRSFRGYDYLDQFDTAALALAVAGLGYLAWSAYALLTGRRSIVLMRFMP